MYRKICGLISYKFPLLLELKYSELIPNLLYRKEISRSIRERYPHNQLFAGQQTRLIGPAKLCHLLLFLLRYFQAVTPAMKSITINDLPDEILLTILLLARAGKADPERVFINNPYGPDMDFLHDPNDVNPNEEYPLYKSARLICKRWKIIATPLLFETLILLSHSKVFYPVIYMSL